MAADVQTLYKGLTLVLASICPPRSNSSATMLVLPLLEATWRGVIPFWQTSQRKERTIYHSIHMYKYTVAYK